MTDKYVNIIYDVGVPHNSAPILTMTNSIWSLGRDLSYPRLVTPRNRVDRIGYARSEKMSPR